MTALIEITAFILGSIALATTLLPLWRTERWWVRVCDFPRLQIAALAVVGVAGVLAWRPDPLSWRGVFAAALLACVVWQLSWVWRYLPGTPRQVPWTTKPPGAAPRLRILIANVLQENRAADRLIALAAREDPDLVLAVETDPWWIERLRAGLGGAYEHVVAEPLDNTYGLVLLSKLPLHEPAIRYLIEPDIPSVHVGLEPAPGARVDFHGVHPRPPRPGDDTGERDTELVVVAREVKRRARPAIVAGDLNDVAWSRSSQLFQRLGGLLDPRRGRGFYSTFSAHVPFLRWPLDHVFHSAEFRLVRLARLGHIGSDHFPVLVELSFEPEKQEGAETPAADAADRDEAREKIATHA